MLEQSYILTAFLFRCGVASDLLVQLDGLHASHPISGHFQDGIVFIYRAIETPPRGSSNHFTMFATRRLLFSTRITFFTRETCGLCTQAKHVLSDVWDKRPFDYTEVNVDLPKPESKQWRDIYDFDVPVVSRNTYLKTLQFLLTSI